MSRPEFLFSTVTAVLPLAPIFFMGAAASLTWFSPVSITTLWRSFQILSWAALVFTGFTILSAANLSSWSGVTKPTLFGLIQ